MINETALRAEIIGAGFKRLQDFADSLGMNITTLHRKLSGKREFSRPEILKMINVLKLSPAKVMYIFFDTKVA